MAQGDKEFFVYTSEGVIGNCQILYKLLSFSVPSFIYSAMPSHIYELSAFSSISALPSAGAYKKYLALALTSGRYLSPVHKRSARCHGCDINLSLLISPVK